MKIQSKFSLLSILLVVLPLVTVTYFQHSSMKRFGNNIAEHTAQILVSKEKDLLRKVVQDYNTVLQRDKKTHERALKIQAREVERHLALEPDPSPQLHFPEAFQRGSNPIPGLGLSYEHMRQTRQGGRGPVWINYKHQVLWRGPGTDPEGESRDLARLSGLSEDYRFVYRLHPQHILWQHTVLESGVQASYPGHAAFPSGYEPREQPWYKEAKRTRSRVQVVLHDPATQALVQVVAMPIERPDGSFAGATAISVPYDRAFRDLQFATLWGESAHVMLALFRQKHKKGDRLQILARESPLQFGSPEGSPPDGQPESRGFHLQGFSEVRKSIRSGEFGVHRIDYRGEEILLAHGSHREGEPFPLILLPYEEIVAGPEAEKEVIRSETAEWILLAGIILLAAALLSVLLALAIARSVTGPVRRLALAARRLAQGDFRTKISLSSGDELQELGDIFNDIGPKLEEHKRMSQALEVARKAQLYLLPHHAPLTKDYDIWGTSLYSDETGGDYYDFIEVESQGANKLAIAVGDVSGHGLGAAFLMASARGIIRSHALQYSLELNDLVRMLNRHLARDSRGDQFLTLFYAVLDPQTHSLTWISAGHEPALCYRAGDGTVEEIPSSGMPLGISEEAVHEEQRTLILQEGDILLIGTDGIREARNSSREAFGRDRVKRILAENADKTTQEICRIIIGSLQEFCGESKQEDDLTLVAIKYQPEGDAASASGNYRQES